MKKKTKRMDRGGEVERRRGRGDDDRMERIRTRRGEAEGRRKSMMDRIEGYRSKSKGDFGSAPAGAKERATAIASKLRGAGIGAMGTPPAGARERAEAIASKLRGVAPQTLPSPSPTQSAMRASLSGQNPQMKQSVVGAPPPNAQQMTQNAMAKFNSAPGAAAQSLPTQRSMISGVSSSPPVRQSVVGSPPPNMAQMTQNAMSQFNSMNNPAAPKMRGGGLARKGVGQALKGGGLARKGVGQALKAGGAVRACGVAKRGKTKGKMV